jgi:hypothetical protein
VGRPFGAIPTSSSDELDETTLSRLLEAVEDAQPVVLHSPHRYAVQLNLRAEDPGDAVRTARLCWKGAIATVGAPTWEVVRAEVMTKAELTHEHDLATAESKVDESPWRPAVQAGASERDWSSNFFTKLSMIRTAGWRARACFGTISTGRSHASTDHSHRAFTSKRRYLSALP